MVNAVHDPKTTQWVLPS